MSSNQIERQKGINEGVADANARNVVLAFLNDHQNKILNQC